jgi:hypothetical protein
LPNGQGSHDPPTIYLTLSDACRKLSTLIQLRTVVRRSIAAGETNAVLSRRQQFSASFRGLGFLARGFEPLAALALTLFLALSLSLSPARAQTALPPNTDGQVMPEIPLRLRVAPGTSYAILRLLDPLTPLTILGVSTDRGWLRVQVPDGTMGWVSAEYVNVFIDLLAEFPHGGAARLTPDVAAHVAQVYALGQARGNNPNVFAKVGDSITVSILTLNPIGDGIYNLGEYTYLEDVIDFYRAGATRDGHNSFNETPLAAAIGWTTYRVLDPAESDPALCSPSESPLLCEYRLLKPSVSLIMLGTNDVSILDTASYRANLETIVQLSEAQGIIPILTTIPDRDGFEERSRVFSQIIANVAAEYAIPLIDYGGAMSALGRDAFDEDNVHPSVPPKGYEGAADFREFNLRYGYVLRNLTALQMLDAVWRTTTAG